MSLQLTIRIFCMNNDWANFLQTQQAHIDETGVSHFADDAAVADQQTDLLCDLSQLGLLRFSGEDAASFLQGQLSNDINVLDGSQSQISSYCSPKGRILASLRVFRDGDDFYLLIPADTLAATKKRLQMYVMMSKVNIDDLSDETVRIGISGQQANTALQQLSLNAPENSNGYVHHNNVHILNISSTCPRYILISDAKTIQPAWEAMKSDLPMKGYNSWNYMDIQDAIPGIVAATVDAFVPQMVNLHAINGVSFSKGCYPGQEIVARMHFLGKLKRRMYRATVHADQAPKPGDSVFSANSTSGQGAGQIVTSAPLGDGNYEILAVIQISAKETGELHLHDIDGSVLQFRDIPYTVSLEREK